jgi:hypothetical protein
MEYAIKSWMGEQYGLQSGKKQGILAYCSVCYACTRTTGLRSMKRKLKPVVLENEAVVSAMTVEDISSGVALKVCAFFV